MTNEERKIEIHKLLEIAERDSDMESQIKYTQELIELNRGEVK